MYSAVPRADVALEADQGAGRPLDSRAREGDAAPVPAIVVGSGLTALGVLRLLHRARIPTYVLSRSPSLESQSRWFRPVPGIGEAIDRSRPLAEALATSTLEKAVLIPCSDAAVNEVAALPPAIAERFVASVASPSVVARLTDKARFATLLADLGVPRPITYRLDRREDLAAVPDAVLATAFLKPRDSSSFLSLFKCKGVRLSGRAEAAERLAKATASGLGMVLQEFIPGPGTCHYLIDGFADSRGSVRALFARHRIRIHPPEFGNSACMVSVPLAEVGEAAEVLRLIVAALGFRGIFSAEFKLDPRDGRFKILEINARAWWYVEYAGRCGVDVCRMAYADALGRNVPEVLSYRVGERLVYPYLDFFAAREEWRAGRLTLGAWIRSWLGAQDPFFNWSDPLPALVEWMGPARRAARRLVRGSAPAP